MAKKFVVFITYGVYVDTPDFIDPDTDEGYRFIADNATHKMFFEDGWREVATESTLEIEDVTGEFAYLTSEGKSNA